MLVSKTFEGFQHLQNIAFCIQSSIKVSTFLFAPLLGPHFVNICSDLVPKCSILGVSWRPAGSKMASKIGQVVIRKHINLVSEAHF